MLLIVIETGIYTVLLFDKGGELSQGQQHTMHDSAIGWLILLIVALILLGIFWYYKQDEIKSAYRWLRWAEIWVVTKVVDDDYTVRWTDTDGTVFDIPVHQALDEIAALKPRYLDARNVDMISTIAMEPLKIPFSIILGLMALWAYSSGPGTQYRRKLNLDGLIKAQSGTFPVVAPFVKFNPSTLPNRPPGSPVPADLPMFSEALGPEEWVAYNEITGPEGTLDEGATYRAFAKQLGPPWRGAVRLAPYKQILLAACCLKASRKRNEADALLGRIALCWSPEGGLNLRKDKKLVKDSLKILRNKKLAGKVLSGCNQHAFQTTALLRALQIARQEGGVMAPAQFVWLRAHDRVLWYPLNNLGRQSFHMEALGAMSHFKAEKRTLRPIPKPKMGDAVEAIVDYMGSRRARPIPHLDYSKSKKRGIKKPKQKRT